MRSRRKHWTSSPCSLAQLFHVFVSLEHMQLSMQLLCVFPGGSGQITDEYQVIHSLHQRIATTGVCQARATVRPGHNFFLFTVLLSKFILHFSRSSSAMSYFILAVLMHKCFGKHLCRSSTLNIAILNFSLCSVKTVIRSASQVLLN